MYVACSAFSPTLERSSAVYNRATLELIKAVLFDHTIVIPMSSLAESIVFHKVFGSFASARRDAGATNVRPLRLSVDKSRHFDFESTDDVKSVVHRALDAYLCGKAHKKEDLWEGDEQRFLEKFKPNFGFIDSQYFANNGRGPILADLRRSDDKVMELFAPYIRDNFDFINSYFYTSPGTMVATTDVFERASYKEYAAPKIMKFAEELDGYAQNPSNRKIMVQVFQRMDEKNAFSVNELAPVGREFFDDWDSTYQPFINAHRWVLDGKLCGAHVNRNIELWGIEGSVFDSMLQAIDEDGVSSAIDISPPDSAAVDKIDFQHWEDVLHIRTGKGREFIDKFKRAEHPSEKMAIWERYLNHISGELSPHVNLLDLEKSAYSLSLNSGDKTGKFHIILDNLALLSGSGIGSYLGFQAADHFGAYSPAAGFALGAAAAGVIKKLTERHIEKTARDARKEIEFKRVKADNHKLLVRHSANIINL